MRRRSTGLASFASNPTMVGALTVLIVIVAVFLAYNANNGLPFVPTYRISAHVPNANSLVEGNDVRIGGVRVGVVETIEPEPTQDPETGEEIYGAKLNLKLDRTVEPLPADSTLIIRSRSALGLKFLEITPGRSDEGLPEGGELPIAQARPEPVEMDEFFSMFKPSTRRYIQQNLVEFGGAVAGRGSSLNAAIYEFAPLVRNLVPVMRNLGSKRTDLNGFFRALEAAAGEVAPVAENQASMFVVLDDTFKALETVARPYIQDTITQGVETERVSLDTMPRIQPFLAHSAALFTDFQPGARALASTAPTLYETFVVGAPVLRRTPILNAQLVPTAQALLDFSNDPDVTSGLQALTRTFGILDTPLRFITPAQTVCNYGTILLDNAGEMQSAGNSRGRWLRSITVIPPTGPNSESGPASRPANGPSKESHLHYNPYPNTAAPGQTRECEAGNEPYLIGQTVIGNVPGNQGTATSRKGGSD
jgi:phospholipid/cholesterol/gamma-HCH transport system substrate-binding protein